MSGNGVYGGLSADERRAQRRARLLAAALEVMGTRGWAQTSVRAVCREARLSARFFYESFDDLDELAVAVFDDLVAETTAAMVEAVATAPADPHAQARAGIGAFVRALTDDPRRARFAFGEALGSEPLMRRRLAAMREIAGLIADHGRATYRPPRGADRLVDVTATMLAGGLVELLLSWLDGSVDATRDELVEDCAAVFMATVEGTAAIGRERSRSQRSG